MDVQINKQKGMDTDQTGRTQPRAVSSSGQVNAAKSPPRQGSWLGPCFTDEEAEGERSCFSRHVPLIALSLSTTTQKMEELLLLYHSPTLGLPPSLVDGLCSSQGHWLTHMYVHTSPAYRVLDCTCSTNTA